MKALLAFLLRHLQGFFFPAAGSAPRAPRQEMLFEALEARVLFTAAPVNPAPPAEEPPAEIAFMSSGPAIETANLEWANDLGDPEGNANAVDGSGNVYVVGSFSGSHDFDPADGSGNVVTLSSKGGADVFLSKFDTDGNLLWAQSFGGSSWDQGNDIDVDGSGNVYVTGSFEGTVDFDPDASGSAFLTSMSGAGGATADAFITKFDTDGNFLWAKSFGGAEGDFGYGIDVDASGNAYVTGAFEDSAASDASGSHLVLGHGNDDAFVAKLDTAGNFQWATAFGGSSWDRGNDIAVDGSGNAFVVGDMQSASASDASGNHQIVSHGNTDVFVTKLNAGGQVEWAAALGGSSWDNGTGIDVDGAGNAYVTGQFNGVGDFDADPSGNSFDLASSGDVDVFVTKLDSAGNTQWAKSFGSDSSGSGDFGSGIDVDEAGNVYLTGQFYGGASGGVDFDPDPSGEYLIESLGQGDVFVSKLDTDGNFKWAVNAGGEGYDEGGELAVDGSGNVYVVGTFRGTADFDPGTRKFLLTGGSSGGAAGFLWKLNQSEVFPNTVFVDDKEQLIVTADGDDDVITVRVVDGNVTIITTDDSLIGGDGTTTNAGGDVVIPLAGLTSILINTGGGNDTINLISLTGFTGNLAVNGEGGFDQIEFGGSAGTHIVLSAGNDVDLHAERIRVNNSSIVTSGDGDIAIIGVGGGNTTFTGITLANSTLNATGPGGDITLIGEGGSVAGTNKGVVISKSSVTTGDGDLIIDGTGGNTTGTNFGVHLVANSTIAAGCAGSLTITGVGGTGANSNDGIFVAGFVVLSVVNGDMTLTGSSGGTSTGNDGIAIENSFLLSTGLGDITLTGTSSVAATGSNNTGVNLSGTTANASGGGSITLTGTGSSASINNNEGVKITSASKLTTASGGVTLNGTAGGSGKNNRGISLISSTIAGGSGKVSLTGQGSLNGTSTYNQGIFAQSANINSSVAISLTGFGGKGTNFNSGIQFQSAKVLAGGKLTVLGAASSGTTGNQNYGVQISNPVTLNGGGGSTITGTGGGGTGTNHGVIASLGFLTNVPLASIIGTAGSGATSKARAGTYFPP